MPAMIVAMTRIAQAGDQAGSLSRNGLPELPTIGADAAAERVGTHAIRYFAGEGMRALTERPRQSREIGAPANGPGIAFRDIPAGPEETDECDPGQYARDGQKYRDEEN